MSSHQTGVALEYLPSDEASGTLRFGFDGETVPPSMAVIAALSEVLDVDPTQMAPLHESVDTDALDALLRGQRGDDSVTFTHMGRTITLYNSSVVAVGQAATDAAVDVPSAGKS